MNTKVLTYSELYFDLINPYVEQVSIEDFAHHLSLLCRYNGALKDFYSIAQHSLFYYYLVISKNINPKLQLAALLHDVAEVYVGDLISPLKYLLPKFKKIEHKMKFVILEKYNLSLTDEELLQIKHSK